MSNVYLALVHAPVTNRAGEEVVTSITNLDIHDIARTCTTYGVKKFIVVNPLQSQKELFDRIRAFWNSEIAERYNKDRVEALSLLQYCFTLDEAFKEVKKQEAVCPLVVTTTAAKLKNQIGIKELVQKLHDSQRPLIIVFGTGNGLCASVHKFADLILKPISGNNKYNHLSVRSAVAIIMDRLSSEK